MEQDGVWIIGNDTDHRLGGKSRRDRSRSHARSRSPMKSMKKATNNRRSQSPAKASKNSRRSRSPLKKRQVEEYQHDDSREAEEGPTMPRGGTLGTSKNPDNSADREENTGKEPSPVRRGSRKTTAPPQRSRNYGPQIVSNVAEQTNAKQTGTDTKTSEEREQPEKNESSGFRLFTHMFSPSSSTKKAATTNDRSSGTIYTKDSTKKSGASKTVATETICVDTAKEILSNRTSLKVFDPSPAVITKKVKADASTHTSPSNSNPSKRRIGAVKPRQELTKISKQALREWLDFALTEIDAAMVQPSIDCGSTISSHGGETTKDKEPEKVSADASKQPSVDAPAPFSFGQFWNGMFSTEPAATTAADTKDTTNTLVAGSPEAPAPETNATFLCS